MNWRSCLLVGGRGPDRLLRRSLIRRVDGVIITLIRRVHSDQRSDNHRVIIASDYHLLCSGVLCPIMPRSLQLSLDHSRPAFQRFLATFIITPGPGDQSCEAGSKTRMRGVSRNGWKLQALLLGPSCVERLQHVIPAANVDLCLQLMSWLLPGRWPAPGET